MACSTSGIRVDRGSSKSIPMMARNRKTQVAIPFPYPFAYADFRHGLNGPLLVRLTTEDGGITVDPDNADRLFLNLTPEDTIALAPTNKTTLVKWQVVFRDTLVDAAAETRWPIQDLTVNATIANELPDPEPPE